MNPQARAARWNWYGPPVTRTLNAAPGPGPLEPAPGWQWAGTDVTVSSISGSGSVPSCSFPGYYPGL